MEVFGLDRQHFLVGSNCIPVYVQEGRRSLLAVRGVGAHLCTWCRPRCTGACTGTCCSLCTQRWPSSSGNTLAAELQGRQDSWNQRAPVPQCPCSTQKEKPSSQSGKLVRIWVFDCHSPKSPHREGRNSCCHITKEEKVGWRDLSSVQSRVPTCS